MSQLYTAHSCRIPFFFMPLTGAVSVAGGASIITGSDMVAVLRDQWISQKFSNPEHGGARKVNADYR